MQMVFGFGVSLRSLLVSSLAMSTNDMKGSDGLSEVIPKGPIDRCHSALEFARLIGKLKTTPRTGWVRRGVPRYESVADHSWRVAALAMLLPRDGSVDISKSIEMAVVHDMAESIVGDITPDDDVSPDVKKDMEYKATEIIANMLASSFADEESAKKSKERLYDCFDQYEERKSPEGIAVKDLDLLDMIIQADTYEKEFDIELNDFFQSTPPERFQNPVIRDIAQSLHDERENRKDSASTSPPKELSGSDAAFVAEYSKASNQTPESLAKMVKALRNWESKE